MKNLKNNTKVKQTKHIARKGRLLLLCTALLAAACEPTGLYDQIADGPVFRVTGISEDATKSAAEFSVPDGETVTLKLTGDSVTAAGDTLRLRVSEMPLDGMLRGAAAASAPAATKATPITDGNFPTSQSFGLLACSYPASAGAVDTWTVHSSPSVIRTDYDAARSKASAKWVPSVRLRWPAAGYVRYFAYAPFTDADRNGTDDLAAAGTLSVTAADRTAPSLTYKVPESVASQVDLLVTTQQSTKEYAGDPDFRDIDIPLRFRHALTGVRFRVGTGLEIVSVKLEGLKDEGTLDLTAGPAWTNMSGTASYSINSPIALTPDPSDTAFRIADADSTMILLPQALDNVKITAVVKREDDGISHTVEADLTGTAWHPGRLVTYTITDTDVSWVFDVLDQSTGQPLEDITLTLAQSAVSNILPLTVTSYRSVNFGGVSKQKEPQAWKAEFRTYDGSSWSAWSDTPPAWLGVMKDESGTPVSGTNGDGGHVPDPRDLNIAENTSRDKATVSVEVGEDRIAMLREQTEVGERTPHDLSMHNIYGQPNGPSQDVAGIVAAGPHTANCYVVSAPGWYCFPLVYGNAIDATRADSGNENTAAYGSSLPETWFIDAGGNRIRSPYIVGDPEADPNVNLADYDAVVIWQDVKAGYEVVKDANIEVVTKSAAGGSLPCPYIRFKIEKGGDKVNQTHYSGYLGGTEAGILPCNVVIGLRDKTKPDDAANNNSPRILWSWHIWVTPVPHGGATQDFSIRELKYRRTENSTTDLGQVRILNCILGWTPPLYFYGGDNIDVRQVQIRFRQTATGGKSKTVTLVQQGETHSSTSSGTVYNGTYYQWGRKDPLLAGAALTGSSANNRSYTSEAGYVIHSGTTQLNSDAAADGPESRYPYLFYRSMYARYDKTIVHTNSPIVLGSIPFWNLLGDYGTESMNRTVKTVYDPCPPGFCVPFNHAFSGFYYQSDPSDETSYVTYGTPAADGWRFTADATAAADPNGYDVFFPYTGWRSNSTNGQFSYNISTSSPGEGVWFASLRVHSFNYRQTVFLKMLSDKTVLDYNMASRGNPVRPIVEEAPAAPIGGVEPYGQGGTGGF